ncbi:MAG: HAMP domain-containing histidine kinase, partial [Deltaproteobacteria bacterium]|nr:HAMP domain-containing histidine kinase [Deltaproteobacteria bacterium]
MFLRKTDQAGISFSIKLSALYTVFFVISSISLFVVAYYFIANLVEQRERDVIGVRVVEYKAWFDEGGVQALQERFNEQVKYNTDIYFVRIFSNYQNFIFLSVPNTKTFELDTLKGIDPYKINIWNVIEEKDQNSIWNIVSTPLRQDVIMQVGKRSSRSYELLSYFRKRFLWFVFPILMVGFAAGSFLTFRVMQPIRKINQTVQKIIDTGQMNERVPERKEHGELDQLAKLFNQMLTKNESLIEAMRNSLDNVAHDLKTPMTRLRGIAELSLRDPDNHLGCLTALTDCMEESEKTVSLLNTLMDISEAEAGAMHLTLKPVSLSEIIQSVCDLYEFVAEDKNIVIKQNPSAQIEVVADNNRLQQAFANLIDNAIKYSPPDSVIEIGVEQNSAHTCISFTDHGTGIDPQDQDKIWDRLYRGDRSRSEKGVGLGLSFVKAIVKAHHGTVRVTSQPHQGSTFEILL